MSVAALASAVLSVLSLRLRDDYFVLATFGFQMTLLSIFNNWIEVTAGPLGIPGIPPPMIFGQVVRSQLGFAIIAVILSASIYVVVIRITTSPFGRVLHAIREDDVFVASLGRNPLYFKATVFAVSAALAGSAGSLYAHYFGYIDPSSFTIIESILVLSMVIIGGAGSHWGPLAGATILVLLPEGLRFIGLPNSAAANLRVIIYGLLLIGMIMVRPRGLVGRYGLRWWG
jgi:branched-chain amino acid transport system permease protein